MITTSGVSLKRTVFSIEDLGDPPSPAVFIEVFRGSGALSGVGGQTWESSICVVAGAFDVEEVDIFEIVLG